MKGRWFRMYDAVVDDPKVQRLSDMAFRTWVNLLCLASRGDGMIGGEIADLSFCLRKSADRTRELLAVLIAAGLLEECEGSYQPRDWNSLQYKSDVSSGRVKRFRERFRNTDETAPEQSRTETESDSESEQNRSSGPPAAGKTDSADDFLEDERKKKKAKPIREDFPEGFEAFWRDYPVEPIMSKTRAYGQWAALSEKDRALAHAALAPFRALCLRDGSYRVLHAERFLSQRRFDGFVNPHRGAAQIETEAARSRWGGAAAALVDEIGAPAFMAYFGEAAFDPGPPARIAIAKGHLRDRAREKYSAVLRRLFGEFTLEAPTTSPLSWPGSAERQRSGTGHPGDANANASEPGTNISSTSRAQAGTP